MKRIFLILLILLTAFSCSSDDDNYKIDQASIIIKFSEISPTQIELMSGIYYEPQDISFLYFLADPQKGTPTYATDGTCPVCKNSKGVIKYEYTQNESTQKIEDLHIHCTKCKSEFDAYSGKGRNDKAKGYNLNVYKAKTIFEDINLKSSGIYIWK